MIGASQNQKVYVHLILPNPKGAIKAEAMNFHVACDPESTLPKHATTLAEAVSCPLCKISDDFKAISEEQSPHSSSADRKAEAFEKAAKTTAKPTTPETPETASA